MTSRRPLRWVSALLLMLAAIGCDRPGTPPPATASPAAKAPEATDPRGVPNRSAPTRDLSVDESMGGHTLMRHVGRTDADLRDRLRRESQISSASTYTDRSAAERAVGSALASGGKRLQAWLARTGRRPNLVLHYANREGPPLGRMLSRGQKTPAPCDRALVVLRWDERRSGFYVLTSYPEADR